MNNFNPRGSRPGHDVPPFCEQYQKFYRVWAEILRDGIEVAVGAATTAEFREAQRMLKAILEAYDHGREKWSPDALAANVGKDA